MAHLHLKELYDVATAGESAEQPIDEGDNRSIYSELVLLLDNVSLSLIMRDAKDNGRKALKILREHYLGKSKPRIISLYSELASLKMSAEENVTDYVLRAEGAAAALKNAEENISDSLLIVMCLRRLPPRFNSFATVMTQKDEVVDFVKLKSALRSSEESEKSRLQYEGDMSDNVMNYSNNPNPLCYHCNKPGHKKISMSKSITKQSFESVPMVCTLQK